MPDPTADPSRRRRMLRTVAVVLAAVAVWQGWVNVAAWRHLRAGRAAVERDDPAAALPHLQAALDAWPASGEAHFLMARASRKAGDLDAAKRHLSDAEHYGIPADRLEVEILLLRALSGDRAGAAADLIRYADAGHDQTPDIAAVLVPALVADFRIVDAGRLAALWVAAAPDSAAGWAQYAEVLERLRRKEEAVAALRRLVALAPDGRKGRAALARMLLEAHQNPDEAAAQAEWLTATDPMDVAAQVQLAACREAQGRPDEAAAVLDRVLAAAPANAAALHRRGRLEMTRGQPAAALPFLRRAADLDPSDAELLYALFVCLQRAGSPAEAKAAEARWRQCDADLKRVGELARVIAANPADPDTRREMGELFLRNGRPEDGVRWLESALRLRPDHAPSHRALAAFYERTGRPDLARRHGAISP